MKDAFRVSKILISSLLLIGLNACNTGDKHDMHIQYEVGKDYPVKAKVSDVRASVRDGEFTSFSGFNATVRAHYTVEGQEDDVWLLRLFMDDFTLDSIYEMELNEMTQQEIEEAVKSEFKEEGHVHRFGNTGENVFIEPIKEAVSLFMDKVNDEPSLFYSGQFFLAENLISSQYSFPGKFYKGTKWEDEFYIIDHEAYGFQPADQSVSLKWELLRLNDEEVTFFGSGKSITDVGMIDMSETKPIDVKRQFGINMVFDRKDFWLKRGNIDLRSENAELVKGINEDTDEVETIRRPYAVRNIKIKYFDKEEEK